MRCSGTGREEHIRTRDETVAELFDELLLKARICLGIEKGEELEEDKEKEEDGDD